MRITMQKAESLTREQMREFLAASEELDFALARRTEIYDLVERTLRRQRYLELTKKDKGVVRRYLAKLSGRSLPQITRLIRQYRQSGAVRVSQPRRRRFPTRYTADDIALLAAVDAAHEGLSGPAVRHILWREYTVYNKAAYQRLASISASHIYNLRRTAAYRQHHVHHTKTRSRGVSIGERRKPDPCGQPGYLRVDTVHQGDTPTRPGLYHINAVDTLTQWQVVGCCETISEAHLIPVLEAILHQFPFLVRGFHSDNGSEFLNHRVEKLLHKLLVGEFTKSRAHRTTDNALVEGKNGAVLRKHIGHEPIAACHAAELQRFYTAEFNSYLNYHRPCGFRGHPAPVSFPGPGLSFRQRLGVSQSPGRETVAQAASGRVHQVAGAPHDRQCSGRGQEWGGAAQAHRTRTDRRLSRGRAAALLHRRVQFVFELSSPLRVRHGGGGRQRQAPAPLSAPRLPHALRKAAFARQLGKPLEAGHQSRFSRATSTPDERHRVRAADAATQEKTAGGLPVTVVRQRPETGLSARDSSGMGGGGGSSTSFLARSTTLQSFPLPPRHPHT